MFCQPDLLGSVGEIKAYAFEIEDKWLTLILKVAWTVLFSPVKNSF